MSAIAADAATATGGARARRASLVGNFGSTTASRAASRRNAKKEVPLFDEPEPGLEMLPCQYGPGPGPAVVHTGGFGSAD